MDVDEYPMTESARLLSRAGVRYVFCAQLSNIAGKMPGIEMADTLGKSLFHEEQIQIRVLWTYAGLSQDLAVSTPPERLDLLYKIQDSVKQLLGWGESGLLTYPMDGGPKVFFQVVQELRPKIILYFGDFLEKLDVVAPQLATRSGISPEFQLINLPSLDDMVLGDQDQKNKAWQILKTIPIH